MSKLLIDRYYTEVKRIIKYGSSRNKSSIQYAFYNLLNKYCKSRDFFSYRAGLLNYSHFNLD